MFWGEWEQGKGLNSVLDYVVFEALIGYLVRFSDPQYSKTLFSLSGYHVHMPDFISFIQICTHFGLIFPFHFFSFFFVIRFVYLFL